MGQWSHSALTPDLAMQPHDSRVEYERRIHRVFEHIDQHLDERLDLATLAAVAHFSPFHFHRLFAAWTGETLGDYLRRRRVELAALQLLRRPSLGVLQAALAVGFGSGEAFTRAFKLRFGVAPSAWRTSKSNSGQVASFERSQNAPSFPPCGNLHVRLTTRTPTAFLYLRRTGPFGEPLGNFWSATVMPRVVADGLSTQARYGLVHDDPDVTDPARCRYDAGCAMPTGHRPSAGWLTSIIAGGGYAVLDFEGVSAEAPGAWNRLLRDWLPSSGMQLDARPYLEHYAPDRPPKTASGVFSCELCLPVEPL
jgi:AraC family transcriptional regulator